MTYFYSMTDEVDTYIFLHYLILISGQFKLLSNLGNAINVLSSHNQILTER